MNPSLIALAVYQACETIGQQYRMHQFNLKRAQP